MKRITLATALISLAGLGFAAGQAVPKVRFPWASADLNKPCGKTELEWRCVANAIGGPGKPAKLSREYKLVQLWAKPTRKGLSVTASIQPRPPFKARPNTKTWWKQMDHNSRLAMHHARRRFVDKDTCDDFRDMRLEFYAGNTLVGTRDINGFKRAKGR
ncbi:MAG: hypothetical protein ACYS5V_16160 [Planctomycetota bacterium]|jgi:hypothetical protein